MARRGRLGRLFRSRDQKPEGHQHTDMIAMCLWDGPRTVPEIQRQFMAFIRRFGFFSAPHTGERDYGEDLQEDLGQHLREMAGVGWVVRQGDRYALTPLGREEAGQRLAALSKVRTRAQKLLEPETVSQVSLGVHLGLAALKLPAGLLSGSVGLINDATDTLLDGLSSLLVYLGLRMEKERAVNVFLVLLMLGTGGLTLYEAIRRFFVPFDPEVDWFTFTAVILSALACGLLYLYQRFVGLRSGQLALITQSVDSRNHVIVAASVTAGLIASLLRFGLLDTLVGLAVAILILKSAIELAIETIRTFGEEEIDLSRHRMGLVERYERLRQAQLRDWMLYVVENGGVSARAELISQARDALDFQDNPALRELGLAQQPQTAELIARGLEELLERGWLAGDEALSITSSGRAHLKQQMSGTRGDRHRLSPGQR